MSELAASGGDEVPAGVMTVALVQMNSGADRDANVAKAVGMIDEAVRDHGADVVVLPEFFNVEYVFMQYDRTLVRLAERDNGPSMAAVRTAAIEHRVHIIATILEEHSPGHIFDTAIVLGPDGEIKGKYRKTHPAATESLEKLFFRYGAHFDAIPLGSWNVGINICYDNELPESARCSALAGADLIVAPFATPLQMPLREMLIARASDNQLFLAACNKVGSEGGLQFCGMSMIIDPLGEVLAIASDSEEQVLSAEVDRRVMLRARQERPLYRDRRPDLYAAIVMAAEDLPARAS
ncbi:MAG TPA: carbon-nitrogen hydrolase family protein [Solirubrobacteraceae bacterium]